MRRFSLMVTILAVVALAAAPAALAGKIRTGPAGARFYTPPKLTGKARHGHVIWERAVKGAAAVKGASRNTLVLYRSTSARGRSVPVSGVVSLPKGKPPRGGWPVVTWAHGTTGIADRCAPSRAAEGDPSAIGANAYVEPLFQRWLKAGWAVVRTDYQGLGTPGVHPYLVGVPSGRDVLDMVRAARELDGRVSRRVAIAGHSQGGHAALWAAGLARSWTPELNVRGTVAFAPASRLQEQIPLVINLKGPGGGLSALVASIGRGLTQADPAADVKGVLSDRARALFPQTLTRCLADLSGSGSYGGITPADLFRPGADLGPIAAALARQDPSRLRFGGDPVRIEQGLGDSTVYPAFTARLDAALKARNKRISMRTYPGVSHVGVVDSAANDATSYIRARLR